MDPGGQASSFVLGVHELLSVWQRKALAVCFAAYAWEESRDGLPGCVYGARNAEWGGGPVVGGAGREGGSCGESARRGGEDGEEGGIGGGAMGLVLALARSAPTGITGLRARSSAAAASAAAEATGVEVALDLACWLRQELPHLQVPLARGKHWVCVEGEQAGGVADYTAAVRAEGSETLETLDLVAFARRLLSLDVECPGTQEPRESQIWKRMIPMLDPRFGVVARDLARACHEFVNAKGLGIGPALGAGEVKWVAAGQGGAGAEGAGTLSQLRLALLRLDAHLAPEAPLKRPPSESTRSSAQECTHFNMLRLYRHLQSLLASSIPDFVALIHFVRSRGEIGASQVRNPRTGDADAVEYGGDAALAFSPPSGEADASGSSRDKTRARWKEDIGVNLQASWGDFVAFVTQVSIDVLVGSGETDEGASGCSPRQRVTAGHLRLLSALVFYEAPGWRVVEACLTPVPRQVLQFLQSSSEHDEGCGGGAGGGIVGAEVTGEDQAPLKAVQIVNTGGQSSEDEVGRESGGGQFVQDDGRQAGREGREGGAREGDAASLAAAFTCARYLGGASSGAGGDCVCLSLAISLRHPPSLPLHQSVCVSACLSLFSLFRGPAPLSLFETCNEHVCMHVRAKRARDLSACTCILFRILQNSRRHAGTSTKAAARSRRTSGALCVSLQPNFLLPRIFLHTCGRPRVFRSANLGHAHIVFDLRRATPTPAPSLLCVSSDQGCVYLYPCVPAPEPACCVFHSSCVFSRPASLSAQPGQSRSHHSHGACLGARLALGAYVPPSPRHNRHAGHTRSKGRWMGHAGHRRRGWK